MRDFQVRRAARLGLFIALVSSISGLSVGTAAGAGAVWPLTPRPAVVRGFEPPPKPWLPGHRGVDLLGTVGQPVRAASAGTIVYAGPLAGRGVVVISHGVFRTTYEPVVPSVHVGDPVLPGQPIGTLSGAPSHCAPRVCLHWGHLRGHTYLNPLTLLSSTPVRLLPTTDEPRSASSGIAGGGDPPAATGQAASAAGTSAAGGVFVGVAALLTIAGGLLIRRH